MHYWRLFEHPRLLFCTYIVLHLLHISLLALAPACLDLVHIIVPVDSFTCCPVERVEIE